MLKTIRIILAIISIAAITLLFVDVSGAVSHYVGWLAKIQLIPAILSLNVLAIIGIVAATLLFGRLYCSIICPLGIFQDIIIKFRKNYSRKKKPGIFKFHTEYKHARYTVLTLFVVFFLLGFINLTSMMIAGFLEPYSAYGRVASQILGPFYDWGNNMLANWSVEHDNYIFSHVATVTHMPLLIVAVITFLVVTVFAWIGGRNYCNIVCPVGSTLGFLSRYAFLKPVIDTTRCNGCRKCERNCKSSCIDAKNHWIDYSRCVVCMDCIGNCSQGAISYTHAKRTNISNVKSDNHDSTRRNFITTGIFMVSALAMKAHEEGDGAIAPIKIKKAPERNTNIVPSGAVSLQNLASHCTACQLCISSCPEGILKPSTKLENFMQPIVSFTEGYCRPECVKCSEVCPAGAILPITVEEKSSIKIGTAVVNPWLCISASEGKDCGLCSRSCPAGAIIMIEDEDSGRMRPTVNEEACIGCGSCEYHCPVGTAGHIDAEHSAIYVEGIQKHRTI